MSHSKAKPAKYKQFNPITGFRTHSGSITLIVGILAGAYFILIGTRTLQRGFPNYRLWWGGAAFAPYAIVIGIAVIFIAFYLRRHK